MRVYTGSFNEGGFEPHELGADPGPPGSPAAVVVGLDDGEPIFVLRANDATAVPMMNLYSAMTEGMLPDGADGQAKAEELEALRQRFVDYQRAHRDRVKLPD